MIGDNFTSCDIEFCVLFSIFQDFIQCLSCYVELLEVEQCQDDDKYHVYAQFSLCPCGMVYAHRVLYSPFQQY
jgi:hypothetical protein